MKFEHLKKNIFSQNGEDGIIEYLLSKIPNKDNWCCEFGAWDGKHFSNTFNLVKDKNYRAVYIEGDEIKFKDLVSTSLYYDQIIPINKFIGIKEDSIDNILNETEIPERFDVLSIDVDGIDYLIWESLEKYSPKIVIIEINSSMSPSGFLTEDELLFDIMKEKSGKQNGGVNFETCYRLGRKKNYFLFCHTGNLIFIHNDFANFFPEKANDEDYMDFFLRNWL